VKFNPQTQFNNQLVNLSIYAKWSGLNLGLDCCKFRKTVFVRKKQLAVVSEFAYLNLQNG